MPNTKLLIFIPFVSVHNANRNQLDAQDGSWLSPANGARQLELLHETEVDNNERRNQRRESQQSTGREYEYTMLSPATMMVITNNFP